MSKRFSDTEKWTDNWFLELSPSAKLLFIFLADNCDIAGFYEKSDKMMSFFLGLTVEEINKASKELQKSVALVDNVYFVKNFIYHQKNTPLNIGNNCHKSIIHRVNKRSIDFKEFYSNDILKVLGADLGLTSHIGIGNGNSKDNSKDNDSEILPEWLDKEVWKEWVAYRKERKKPLTPRTIKLQLDDLAQHKADHAQMIKNSIKNGWTGLFPLKTKKNKITIIR